MEKIDIPAISNIIQMRIPDSSLSRLLFGRAGMEHSRQSRRSPGILESLIMAEMENITMTASIINTTGSGLSPHGDKAVIIPTRVISPTLMPIPANVLANFPREFLNGNTRDNTAWPGKYRKKGNISTTARIPGRK